MNDDDIDDSLKEKWKKVLDPYNEKLISQEIDRLAKLTETKILGYQENFILLSVDMNKHLKI